MDEYESDKGWQEATKSRVGALVKLNGFSFRMWVVMKWRFEGNPAVETYWVVNRECLINGEYDTHYAIIHRRTIVWRIVIV